MNVKKNALKQYEQAELQAVRNTKLASHHVLAPREVAAIRAQIGRNVRDYLPLVDEVIQGTRTWSPTQARVFTALLNKVVPDLSANFVQQEVNVTHDFSKLSKADLERIAAGAEEAAAEADDAIDGEVLSSSDVDEQ